MASISCVYCGGSHTTAARCASAGSDNDGSESRRRRRARRHRRRTCSPTSRSARIAGSSPTRSALTPPGPATAPPAPGARSRTSWAATSSSPQVRHVPAEWADAPTITVARTHRSCVRRTAAAGRRTHRRGAGGRRHDGTRGVAARHVRRCRCTRSGRGSSSTTTRCATCSPTNSVDARGARRWAGRRPAMSVSATARWPGSTAARSASPLRCDGVPVVHRVAVEHGARVAPTGQRVHRRARARPAGGRHPRRRRGTHHRPGRVGQDPGAHRAGPSPRHAVAPAHLGRLPRGVQQTGAGGDRRPNTRPARPAGPHAQRHRARHRQRHPRRSPAEPSGSPPIDEPEVRRLIGKLVTFPRKRNADPVATWIEALSAARLGLRSPRRRRRRSTTATSTASPRCSPPYRARLATGRSGRLRRADRPRHRAAAHRPQRCAAAAQRACRVLLVDEFQDLTPAHLLLVRLLAGPDGAVFGVGDDDQTIYGYNGADPGWLIDFAALVPRRRRAPAGGQLSLPGRHRARRRHAAATQSPACAQDRSVPHTPARRRVHGRRRPARLRRHHGAGDPHRGRCRAWHPAMSPCSPASTPCSPRCRSRCNRRASPSSAGVGTEFMERTAVRGRTGVAASRHRQGRLLPHRRRRGTAPTVALDEPAHRRLGRRADIARRRSSAWPARITTEKDATTVLEFAADIEVLQTKAGRSVPTAQLFAVLRDQMGLAQEHRHARSAPPGHEPRRPERRPRRARPVGRAATRSEGLRVMAAHRTRGASGRPAPASPSPPCTG